jgi:hypothetical protein
LNLDLFRTLPGSKATGAQQVGRLTHLMQLSVETNWYIRYHSPTNPDADAAFAQVFRRLPVGNSRRERFMRPRASGIIERMNERRRDEQGRRAQCRC